MTKKSKLASPKVRKFARELGANIIEIQGREKSIYSIWKKMNCKR